ncbi:MULTISPECIES: DUF2254 domain-containing protein [unclassified Sulfitobacter]|jgi:uncharacterized membrane protein|uniref:DUF2254 domain-containing protein n=3 Tax=Sulfitobacter TaxID=60136 RepID=UPI0007C2B7E5|nr:MULTISPECIES: DUF2254 domain-containing protein [unclassified Sulfitobacter]KZY04506.1 hypothetical protein A3721_16405 [Sulfitobacter sp. HI0023]KZZ70205.1 hypothetical protein A3764_08345 [Sulfitobacter sp. HI0129]
MDLDFLTPDTLLRKAREYSRKLWVRVLAMGLLAFVVLGVTQLLEGLVPKKLAVTLSGSAADRLLQIIADAMLAVTIFSITIMVTVYRATSTQWTPRVHRLIIQDRTTQNTIAVFIGAYVYALVAIIMRELGIYVDERAFVLFIVTVLVLAIIVINLIRWVLHLQTFGSLIDTTRQVEKVTRAQFEDRLKEPCLGAHPLTGDIPEDAEVMRAAQTGYIQHIYPEAMDEIAKKHGMEVFLNRPIGSFVFENEPLLQVAQRGEPTREGGRDRDKFERHLRDCIVIGDLRTYDQDPRFGLVVMGEVGSKALSPGVNDPGTAIDVITRLGRILSDYRDEARMDVPVRLTNLHVPPIDPDDLMEDGFNAMARDGDAVVEVQLRLQATLSGLMRHPDDGLSKAARAAAELHLLRAVSVTSFAPDRERLRKAARSDVWDAVQERLEKETDAKSYEKDGEGKADLDTDGVGAS